MLVPFAPFVPRGGDDVPVPTPPGIKVGDKFYADPGLGFQWLTLDRATLKPIKTGNTSFDPRASDGDAQLDAVAKAVAKDGKGDLVVLAHPGATLAPLTGGQVDKFNSILKLLGVAPLDNDSLTDERQQIVVVGVPYAGDGSGWSSEIKVFNNGKSVLNGFLMPDSVEAAPGVPNFRFQPERVKFDTFNGRNDGGNLRNEMQLGGEMVTAPPPRSGLAAAGGFQVVAIDPDTFEPVNPGTDNRTFVTSPLNFGAPADAIDQREAMANYLTQLANRNVLVAVQSIGRVSVDPPAGADKGASDAAVSSWRDISKALQALGANPDTFYRSNGLSNDEGAYAFIGGPMLERSEVVDSSSATTLDPTRDDPRHPGHPVSESGALQGFASVRSDGNMRPAVADPSDALPFEMYDFAFQAPTPWPHTDPSDPEAGAYKRALAYVSTCLPEFEGWGPDLRSAYAGNLNLKYGAAMTHLDKLSYPGDGPRTCEHWDYTEAPGFTPDQFSQLRDELDQEFVWLDSIGDLFGAGQSALSRSGGEQLVDLKTIGDNIKDLIPPPSPGAEIGEAIGRFILGMFETLGEVAESASGLGFVAAVTAMYELSFSIASAADTGEPLGDKVDKKVDELSDDAAHRLSAAADGLDRLRQVIISDYGRLKALGSVANTKAYNPDTATMSHKMTTAANGWFSTTLLPLLYGVHALHLRDIAKHEATTDNCYITLPAGYLFSKEPDSAQVKFYGDFNRDGYRGEYPTLFALGLHNLHDGPPYVPSATLADSIFHSEAQGGYGVQLSQFAWEGYDSPTAPTDIAICN
jgi:hypothetical protein